MRPMKRLCRRAIMGSIVLTLTAWLLWQFFPWQPLEAVASLSDPAKLATLGERVANPRLIKILYWIDEARAQGVPPEVMVRLAQIRNRTSEPRATLVRQSLERNLKIADELGLFTPDNCVRMRHGRAPFVMRGPYKDSSIEVDHIVPLSLAKEVGNELANLEIMPEALNRRKSNRVGERQLSHAQKLFEAGLLSEECLGRVRARAKVTE
jgi:hypothetical protein